VELPWDHLFTDLKRDFLLSERKKSIDGLFTPDCSTESCSQCGICDFKEIKPMTDVNVGLPRKDDTTKQSSSDSSYKYSINFSKTDNAIFFGHIDLMNIFRRAFRRADLPLIYSEGYNPRPKISSAAALSVGVASEDEWFEIELATEWNDSAILNVLEGVFPSGIKINKVIKSSQPNVLKPTSCIYQIDISNETESSDKIEEFYTSGAVKITKRGKKGPKEIDLKESVIRLAQISDRAIEVEIKSGSGMASIIDVARWLLKEDEIDGITKRKTCLTN
jgi:radical SAM-linked protein